MAGITLQQAEDALSAAVAALASAGSMQSYSVSSTSGGRTVQRAAHADLLKTVQYWEQKVAQLSRGRGLKTWSAVPL